MIKMVVKHVITPRSHENKFADVRTLEATIHECKIEKNMIPGCGLAPPSATPTLPSMVSLLLLPQSSQIFVFVIDLIKGFLLVFSSSALFLGASLVGPPPTHITPEGGRRELGTLPTTLGGAGEWGRPSHFGVGGVRPAPQQMYGSLWNQLFNSETHWPWVAKRQRQRRKKHGTLFKLCMDDQ